MNTQLFNAVLVTDRGLIIEDVEAAEVGEVIPYLRVKYDLREITHYVIYLGEKINAPKKRSAKIENVFPQLSLRFFKVLHVEF